MARQRVPPEVRRRTWTEGTIWDLLIAAGALPYRFTSPFVDLGMTASQRRRLRREEELLKITHIAYILPRPGTARRPPQPWLYVRTRRTGHYRVGESGAIERFGRRTQRLGSGSITEHRWYPCTLRGVRWLQVIADGRMVRKGQDEPGTLAPIATTPQVSREQQMPQGNRARPVQLALFSGADEDGAIAAISENNQPVCGPPISPASSPHENAGVPRSPATRR